MRTVNYITVIVAMLCALQLYGTPRTVTLSEAIELAKVQSVDAAVAINELRAAYWEYHTFKADMLPEVNFSASLPSYNQNYTTYQQADGSYTYVRNNYLGMNGEISINQNIPFTGGSISLNTSLDYLRQLDSDKGGRFMTIPFAITWNQPIFGVNSMKWEKKIEPVKYREAQAKFLSQMEEVTMLAINYYFNLLLAQENVEIATQNLNNAQKLYEVAKAKRKMGQISENDLLQMELNVLDSKAEFTDNESQHKSAMFKLRAFLGLDEETIIEAVIPENVVCGVLEYENVLQKALDNNYFSKNIMRRRLEAEYNVAATKGNLRSITLFAQVGYTGTDQLLEQAYSNLKNNQIVQVGLKIPILDWGKRRGKVKMAQSNYEVVESRIKQETMNFNQNIFILVEQFNNQKAQMENAEAANRIAQKRYDTNVETFLIGRISTLDLNDSQSKKDYAKQNYINELFYYWYYYYQIRSLTLWDYENEKEIYLDLDDFM